jgi:uncharacterized protein (DUF39 family)
MSFKVNKTIAEINEKIRRGRVVVVNAEEMIDIVAKEGPVEAARKVDVVTTGTFAPMCSSGVFLNVGHAAPKIKASRAWVNKVPAYGGIAAVDFFLGATEPSEDDPLNKVHPGQFRYGGGHVIQDLVNGKKVHIYMEGYGTDCYPAKSAEKDLDLDSMSDAILCNPRNLYQNYNCAVNLTEKTIYTYMGVLRPRGGNATYCSAGQLSPLLNDPYYLTTGLGTKIFLGGGVGFVTWHGTQHSPYVSRGENGVVKEGAGTLMLTGNLKEMSPRWLVGVSMLGYGCSLAVGVGVPIPILNEQMARFTAVRDEEIFTQIVDYGYDYPTAISRSHGEVSYAELKSGSIDFDGRRIPATPLSSYSRALEIAEILKEWIAEGRFVLGEAQKLFPGSELV